MDEHWDYHEGEERYARRKAYAGELVPSMKRRAACHDYRARRMYMITLCVEGRRPLLGQLTGGVEAAHVELTALGEAVAQVWESIPNHHPGVEVLALQLMPDHLHGILFVKEYLEEGLGKVILGFKQACNKEYRRLEAAGQLRGQQPSPEGLGSVAVTRQPTQQTTQQTGQQPTQQTTQQTGQQPTQQTTQQTGQQPTQQASQLRTGDRRQERHTGHEAGLLFERGYHDRILLRDGQLESMKAYMAENPRRLALKRARPEWLRVHQGVDVCGRRCSGVGNLALLGARKKVRVRISRSISPEALALEQAQLLAAAREGAVLVSPCISPGEKAITRAAFEQGLPLIVLTDNGFDPLTKPSGERFYACAEGRLLLLSPFPHRNERRVITRAVCEELNGLAWEIAQEGR